MHHTNLYQIISLCHCIVQRDVVYILLRALHVPIKIAKVW